jgi:hypothetical protein
MGKVSQWAQNLIDHAMQCPECGHKEAEMDCTCGDDLCLCYIQRVAADTEIHKTEHERGEHDGW